MVHLQKLKMLGSWALSAGVGVGDRSLALRGLLHLCPQFQGQESGCSDLGGWEDL